MAGKSIYRLWCEGCGHEMEVSEVPIPNHPAGVDIHLHAVCENTRCAERGKPVHCDHIFACNGRADCSIHNEGKPHNAYRACDGGHACVAGCP